jgi:hypothetical protein
LLFAHQQHFWCTPLGQNCLKTTHHKYGPSVGAAESAAPGPGNEVESPYLDFMEYFVAKSADCHSFRINIIERKFFIP